MGCINSSNKQLFPKKSDNIFNVSVVRVHSEQSVELAAHGQIEITPSELLFVAPNQDSVSWALQHLRRYGLTDNIFSFEAGRRCATGPGIYTFRCCNADQLYAKFQFYINLMSSAAERDRGINSTHPSHFFERVDTHQQQNANQYLEPASLLSSIMDQFPAAESQPINDNNEPSLSSPVSILSHSFASEVVQNQSVLTYSNINANNSHFNIYMDQPLPVNSENNNNRTGICTGNILYKTMAKSSFDAPPEECAPILSPRSDESQVTYSNVDMISTSRSHVNNASTDNTKPAYVNVDLNSSSLPQLSQNISQSNSTPERLNNTAVNAVVNYIILDLDQPRSPSQTSPKAKYGSGQLLSERHGDVAIFNVEKSMSEAMTLSSGSSTIPKRTTVSGSKSKLWNHNIESSGSYTRIDFLKTFALMKSSTNYSDFDPDTEQEESRITRHSKFVRKAYSISE